MYIGCHLSVGKGYLNMVEEAMSIGANTFQFFTRNPRGGASKPLVKKDVEAMIELMQASDFAPVLAHAPYTLNPCSANEKTRNFAWQAFAEDLEKMENLPGNYYNFHPGSHVGQGVETGINLIVEMLNATIKPGLKTKILLETMAGKGSEVGSKFEEIREIIDRTTHNEALGVCLDTCHIYDAGYDIVNDLDGVLEAFDKIIGLDRLYAIHLNDSKNPFSSHKDRHEKIGKGTLGVEAIKNIINHPKLKQLPFYLETPNEIEGYAEEIQLLLSLREEQ